MRCQGGDFIQSKDLILFKLQDKQTVNQNFLILKIGTILLDPIVKSVKFAIIATIWAYHKR